MSFVKRNTANSVIPPIDNKTIGAVLAFVKDDIKEFSLPIVTLHAQHKQDPYRVLIATMLSLRTKDQVTAVACERLFAVADTPQAMLKLPEATLSKLIYPVGFYKTKAKAILETSRRVIDEFGGAVPKDIDVLCTLPGVGRKTANLVLTLGHRIPAMCVDTHVHRISNRFGYVETKTPEKTEVALRAKLPKEHWMSYNDLLVSFGQHRCFPVSPKCSTCPVRKLCPRVGVTTSR
jgi:endonuclease-3